MPRVSVLMPTYNTREDYLREAIQSIRCQSFSDFELLILDDGSANCAEIREIALSFADPRIYFSANETNTGISPARNKLIAMARGEYLAVCDHDDISMPERLQKQVEFLDRNPETGVVGGAIFKMSRGKIIEYPKDNKALEELLLVDCVVEHPLAMIRKSVLQRTGVKYEEEFTPAEDYALWCRLIGKTRFANLPDVLLRYREHQESATHAMSANMREATTRIMAFARSANPVLWNRVQKRIIDINRYCIFGFLPLMTVRTQGKKTKYLLFGCLPVLVSRRASKSQGIVSRRAWWALRGRKAM